MNKHTDMKVSMKMTLLSHACISENAYRYAECCDTKGRHT